MMDGAFEFLPQRAGMFGSDSRDQHWLSAIEQLGGDFDHLFRRFAGAKNDFGEIFAQRAVRVHLRKTEIGHRRGLKRVQHLSRAGFFPREIVPAIAAPRQLSWQDNASRNARCHARKPSVHGWINGLLDKPISPCRSSFIHQSNYPSIRSFNAARRAAVCR